jgi:RNA polymerase sigma-70 factor (ECF subfamily)
MSREALGSDQALDLTRECLTGLPGKRTVAAADRGRGRFCSFLPADCTHFLVHRRERDRALKRGGGIAPLSMVRADADGAGPRAGATP